MRVYTEATSAEAATRSSRPARRWSAADDGRRDSDATGRVPPPPDGPLPRKVEKPWGHEVVWAHTDHYVGKLLVIEAGKRLSLQHHEVKDEWIHVLEGWLLLTLESDNGTVDDRVLGPARARGRRRDAAIASRRSRHATLIEVSTPELNDVVRLQDDFGREGTTSPNRRDATDPRPRWATSSPRRQTSY